jgi:hypothetical protein
MAARTRKKQSMEGNKRRDVKRGPSQGREEEARTKEK